MALSAKLQARQTQSLVITPQLMQAIRLLGMSSLELDSFIAGEIQQNPLLEREEAAEASQEPAGIAEEDRDEAPAADCAENGADGLQETGERSDEEFGWRAPSGSPGMATSEWQDFGNDPGLTATVSLAEMLERNIEAVFAAAPADRLIATALLSALDECGYLAEPFDEIAARLGAPLADAERILRICQGLAPAGIFARSLRECLGLQLAEQGRLDPAMGALLQNLHYLAAGDRIALCKLCGVDRDDLDDMIAEIRALDPKPGLAFAHEPVRSLVPDVFVRPAPDGSWTVELNDDALPKVLVNRVYIAEVSASAKSETERRYLTECLQKASWLEKSLDQRAKTVLRVAAEIVRHQQGFLANGMGYLRPLNLRMVADALGVHESTVSRAAANKTISTPRGVFDFRDFFSGSIADSSGGEAHSAQAVKHRIRRLIGEESPDAILSDDALVAQLSREGIEIARRTVAKYRELMRIGSSVERRREKRLRAAS